MPTVLERDSDHVDFLRRIGLKCYYGDVTRPDLLEAAGAPDAKLLVLAIDDEDECMEVIDICRKHFPHLKIFARACSRHHAYELHEAGVKFYVEQLSSALDCVTDVLGALGHSESYAKDAVSKFKRHENEMIRQSAPHYNNEKTYMDMAQQQLRDLDSLLVNAPVGEQEESE